MSPEILSTIITGLVGLMTALAGINLSKNRKLEKSHKDLVVEFSSIKKEVRILRKLDLLKTRHIYAVAKARAQGIQEPEYPEEIAVLEKALEVLENQEAQIELDMDSVA